MTRYIGIDLSTKTGFCVIEGDDTYTEEITTTIKEDPLRMIDIVDQLIRRIKLTKAEDVIAVEGFSFGSRGAGVSFQYGLGWILRAELIKAGYTYIDVPPTVVKKFACGKGNAGKDALVLPIYKTWGFEHDSDNVRDAYVLSRIAQALTTKQELKAYQHDALKKITG